MQTRVKSVGLRLSGRVALVTGAARGIGAAIAAALASEGARVVVSDIDDPGQVVERILGEGGEAAGISADVTDRRQVEALVAETVRRFGSLAVLVNNAGLFTTLRYKSLLDISEDEWDDVMRVNVRGTFQCVKAVLPSMKKLGSGKIINISSSTVFAGVPRMLHYVSSKGAVVAMTRALARELGSDNICVNSLALGLTLSERVSGNPEFEHRRQANLVTRSIKRDQLMEDCTGAAVFLASADSDFVTGQNIVIDGGVVMR